MHGFKSKRFFNLPETVKKIAPHPTDGAYNRGYAGIGIEKIVQTDFDDQVAISALRQRPDHRETFDIGKFDDADDAVQNIWLPPQVEKEVGLEGMQTFFKHFYQLCYGFEQAILRAISLKLVGPDQEDFLSHFHSKADNQIRLAHYPAIPAQALLTGETERITSHSDFGTITILFQDETGGLEIEDPNQPGEFFRAPPFPGAALVNVGDLLMRWTNGVFRSPLHRVGPPSQAQSDDHIFPSRYSIPYFCGPDRKSVIECLSSCIGPGRPKQFDSITTEEYMDMRLKALFVKSV